MPRPRNTESRRAEIVSGLMHAMAEHGYERATVLRIADCAGLTAGLVHYHFGSKEEILLALGEHLAQRIAERYRQLSERSTKRQSAHASRQPLYDYLDAHLALGNESDQVVVAAWLALGAAAATKPEVGRLYERLLLQKHEQLRELVRETLRSEGRSRRNAGTLAAALLASIEGFLRVARAAERVIPGGSAARAARATLDGLIDAQSSV